jgi:hypothetical protein
LLKEGTVSGQEAAARALGQLARDQEHVKAMRAEGVSAVFTHILGNHAAAMKVQVGLTTAAFSALSVHMHTPVSLFVGTLGCTILCVVGSEISIPYCQLSGHLVFSG